MKNVDTVNIDIDLVRKLIGEQFPKWAHLPIYPVQASGWDNRTFHLGDTMSVRLPSAERYADKVHKEQKWLPFLAQQLTMPIPTPLAMGNPSKEYPWHWSIYRWIEGKSANLFNADELDLPSIARQLALFLKELQKIDSEGVPLVGGPHNFFRGDSTRVYDTQAREAIVQLQDLIDAPAALHVWQKSISTTWDKKPVWIHGDVSEGNILIKDGKLSAVIDFGGMGIGDPACDLVIAWNFFHGESREVFKSAMDLDQATWERARGWAIWKALITVASLEDKKGAKAQKQMNIINDIIDESHMRDVGCNSDN
jgi:aminoglycoside phosphotransferase (APT) family kinase protein